MSGGAYNYFYFKLEEFVQEVRERLDEQQADLNSYGEEPLKYRKELLEILEILSPLCKKIEWTDSGDSGSASENELTKEGFEKIIKILNKSNFLDTCGK